jgi:hypothetical protein
MEAISGRKTIQQISSEHAMNRLTAAHLAVRPDPVEPVEAAAALMPVNYGRWSITTIPGSLNNTQWALL